MQAVYHGRDRVEMLKFLLLSRYCWDAGEVTHLLPGFCQLLFDFRSLHRGFNQLLVGFGQLRRSFRQLLSHFRESPCTTTVQSLAILTAANFFAGSGVEGGGKNHRMARWLHYHPNLLIHIT
jgi:hypothetical protein